MKIVTMAMVLPLGLLGACGQSGIGPDQMTALAFAGPDREKPDPGNGDKADKSDKSDDHASRDPSDKGQHAKPPMDVPEGEGASPVDNDVIIPKPSQPKPKGTPCCAG